MLTVFSSNKNNCVRFCLSLSFLYVCERISACECLYLCGHDEISTTTMAIRQLYSCRNLMNHQTKYDEIRSNWKRENYKLK